MLDAIAPWLVGAALVFGSLAKAVDAGAFTAHARVIALLPAGAVAPAAVVLIGFEGGLGAACWSGLRPDIVRPLVVATITMLTGVSLFAARAGRARSCGCYGRFLTLSPPQGAAVNAVLLALVAGSRWDEAGPAAGRAPLAAAMVASALAAFTLSRGPLIDLSPLRRNQRWMLAAREGVPSLADGRWLVLFLSPTCGLCRTFVKAANALQRAGVEPRMLGFVATSAGSVVEWNAEFPVVPLPGADFYELVSGTPVCVELESGVVRDRWDGRMPPWAADRLRALRAGAIEGSFDPGH